MERGQNCNLTVKFNRSRVTMAHGPCLSTSHSFQLFQKSFKHEKADKFLFPLHLSLCNAIFQCTSASIHPASVKTYQNHLSPTKMTHYTVSLKHVGWLLKGQKLQSIGVFRILGNFKNLSISNTVPVQEELSQLVDGKIS